MEYTVFDRGAAVGSASAERRGLYWHIAAECRMETERIVRLYAHDGEKNVRLGVLMPEDDALRLERRLAADAFSFTPQTRVTTSPDTEPAAPERPAEKEAAEAAAEPEQTAWAAWEPFSGGFWTAWWKTRGCGGRRTARSLTWIMSRAGNFR